MEHVLAHRHNGLCMQLLAVMPTLLTVHWLLLLPLLLLGLGRLGLATLAVSAVY